MSTSRLGIPTLTSLVLATLASQAACASPTHVENRSTYHAPRAETAPVVDGDASDAAWQAAPWRDIAYRWLGPEFSAADFRGRYKVVWTTDKLYILAGAVLG